MKNHLEIRLTGLLAERESVSTEHEDLIRLETLGSAGDVHRTRIEALRDEAKRLDEEIEKLTEDIEREKAAEARAKAVHRVAAGSVGVDVDGPIYRTYAEYARDFILARANIESASAIRGIVGRGAVEAARERLELLERTVGLNGDDPTTIGAGNGSGNLAGLNPNQHIAQIFQVINKNRALVDSGTHVDLERGTLTYPAVTARPTVAVQTEMTAISATSTGNTKMTVGLQTAPADVYIGVGELSWQSLNWSTPSALQLWLDLCAADYALKTEQAAATVVQTSGKSYDIASALGATFTYSQFLTAVGAGAAAVYSNSQREADTIYMAVDAFWYTFGLSSDQFAQFAPVSIDGVGPMKIVRTRGLAAGSMVVGDSSALLVAESPGAPVELQVTQPAVGAIELGLIGGFKAVAVDPGAFSHITSAS